MKSEIVLSLLLLGFVPTTTAEPSDHQIPGVVYQDAYEKPVWVSQSAVEADPSLLSAVLPHGTLQLVQAWSEPDQCIEMVVQDEGRSSASDDLATDVKKAERLLVGQITAREAGLFQGRPGTLLRIRLLETAFGEERGGEELVFFPVGQVRVGTTTLCGTDPRFATTPEIGQELILVVPPHWFNSGDILFVNGGRGLLPIEGGDVVTPNPQGQKGPSRRTKADFLRWVHELRTERSGS